MAEGALGQTTERQEGERRAGEVNGWLLLLNLFSLLVVLLWTLVLVQRLSSAPGRLHDFVQEWTSAKNFLNGQPIYGSLNGSLKRYFGIDYQGAVQVNAHPPASVLITLPFGLLQYRTAFQLWGAASLLMLAVGLVMIYRNSDGAFTAWSLMPAVALILSSNSFAQQVNQGQLNLLLFLLLTMAWVWMKHGRDRAVGAVLGLATAIKLFPGFLVIFLIARRKWAAILSAAVSFLAVTGLAVAVLGVGATTSYIRDVMPQLAPFREHWLNASLAGLWNKLFGTITGHSRPLLPSPFLAVLLTVLSVGVVTGLSWLFAARSQEREGEERAFALCVIAMLLVSPVTWDHYFVMLLLPLAILWRIDGTTWRRRAVLVGSFVVLLTIYPKWIWDATIAGNGELAYESTSVAEPWQVVTLLSFQLYALLGLFAVVWWWARATEAEASARDGVASGSSLAG